MLNAVFLIHMLLRAYMMLVFVWVMGSWFPQWRYQAWFRTVDKLVRPYVDVFKVLPLQFGNMDFTPMVAVFVLVIFTRMIESMAGKI